MQNRELFTEAGGEQFDYIPALNDKPEHTGLLTDIIIQHLQGWEMKPEDLTEQANRAKELGERQ